MKILTNISCFLFVIVVLAACDKEGTQMFDKDGASANFSAKLTQFSFYGKSNSVDTVDIPFYINGLGVDYVRSASFEIIQDSTSALDADYSIVSTEVLPNEFTGTIKVKVNKPADEDLSVYFRVVNGDDFTVGLADVTDHKLVITNKLTPPHRWNHEYDGLWKSMYYLGTYSTAYYKFIMEKTGETQYPYPYAVPGYNNDEVWSWTYSDVFIVKLTSELRKYNESIAPDVLLHDDGPAKGLPVEVGTYYTFD